jgi:hypothetical protein
VHALERMGGRTEISRIHSFIGWRPGAVRQSGKERASALLALAMILPTAVKGSDTYKQELGLLYFAIFFNQINSTTFVLFDKYCPIVDQLGSKDSSRDFQLNRVINYFLSTFNTPCKRLKIDVIER